MKVRKLFTVLSAAFVAFSGYAVPVQATETDSQSFDDWCMDEFVASMESDYLTLHSTVADYEFYGITKPEVTFGTLSDQDFQDAVDSAQESLNALHAFDVSDLSAEQRITYDCYERALNYTITVDSYPEFVECFNPYNGYFFDLSTIFLEFPFYADEDVQDYLTLLSDVPRFVDEMIDFTNRQVVDNQGYFMTSSGVDTALETIDSFISKTDDNSLIVVFNERLQNYDGGLTDAQKQAYMEENATLVTEQIIPAYQKVRDYLDGMRSYCATTNRNNYDPAWDEVYAAILNYKTGTELSASELYSWLADCYNQASDYLYNGYLAFGSDDSGNVKDVSEVDMSDPEEIMDYLRANLGTSFPWDSDIAYELSYLDESIDLPGVLAYYNTTAIDRWQTDSTIRLNANAFADETTTTLYTTLAHEGYPGHMYAYTYYLSTNPEPLRALTGNLGYDEGWGMYVMDQALMVSGLDDWSMLAQRMQMYMGYLGDGLLDLYVNYVDDSDLQGLSDIADQLGYDSSQELYDYFLDSAGTILPYSAGFAAMMTEREKVLQCLGEDYDQAAFNAVILDNGPRYFTLVDEDVNAFIEENGGTVDAQSQYLPYTYEDTKLSQEYGLNQDTLPQEPQATDPGTSQSTQQSSSLNSGLIIGVLVAVIVLIALLRTLRGNKKMEEQAKAEMGSGEEWIPDDRNTDDPDSRHTDQL